LLVDVQAPELEGMELMGTIELERPGTDVILMTGADNRAAKPYTA
jgi:FixJ family two-component response regulator